MKTYLSRLWAALRGRDLETENVRAFFAKFGFLDYDHPGPLTARKLGERLECMREELAELQDAETLEDQADALVDLAYFVKGTAIHMGLPWEALWADVHRANLTKERGVKPGREHLVDVVKPAGWVPPQGLTLIANAGWEFQGDPLWEVPVSRFRDDDVHLMVAQAEADRTNVRWQPFANPHALLESDQASSSVMEMGAEELAARFPLPDASYPSPNVSLDADPVWDRISAEINKEQRS